jgi:short-subunit dehydrogenase
MIGMVYLTQLFLPIMKQNGKGQIINISSISGFWSQEKNAFYSATKH